MSLKTSRKPFFLLLLIILFLCLYTTSSLADVQVDHRVDTSGNYANIDTSVDAFIAADTVSNQGGIIAPIVFDMDSDGNDELIVSDATYLKLYNWNKTGQALNYVDGYDNGARLLTDPFVSDESGTPTIFYVTNDQWHALQYNGTGFTHYNYSFNFYALTGGFGCGEIDNSFYCFLVDPYSSGVASEMRLRWLNATTPSSLSVGSVTINSDGCTVGRAYHVAERPELRGVLVHNDAAFFTWWPDCSGAAIGLDTRLAMLETDFTVTEQAIDDGDCTCDNAVVTTPLNLQNSGGVLLACETSSTNYDVCKYSDTSLAYQGSYPGILNDVEGNILSNMFRIDCFQDTGATDVGILGYRESDQSMNLLCVNDNPGIADTDREFDQYYLANITSNSTETFTANMQGGTGKDALFTRFGVLSTTSTRNDAWYNPFSSEGEIGASYTWTHGVNGVTMPLSMNGDPADILIVSPTNIYIFDDDYVNTEPDITQACVDPCNKICVGQDVTTTFTVTDADSDRVDIYLYAYEGTAEERILSVLDAPSGQTNYLTFTANVSMFNAPLTLVVTDNSTESVGNTSYTYNMQITNTTDCKTAGECSSCFTSVTTEDEDVGNFSQEPVDNNQDSVSQLIGSVNGVTGLGTSLIWLILMALAAWAIWTKTPHVTEAQSKMAFGITGIVEVLLLIIGTRLGFLGFGILLTIVILAAAVIVWYLAQKLGGR